MRPLSFEQIKPGMKVVILGFIDEGLPEEAGVPDTVVSTSAGHLDIYTVRLAIMGNVIADGLVFYEDNSKTRTIFLIDGKEIMDPE